MGKTLGAQSEIATSALKPLSELIQLTLCQRTLSRENFHKNTMISVKTESVGSHLYRSAML